MIRKEMPNMRNMKCGGVKAPSAWLTYIGSLPLTSHHGFISNQPRPAHGHTQRHTHPLSDTQEALFIDASP